MNKQTDTIYNFAKRAAMTLAVMLITTATAWAQNPATIGSIQYNSTGGYYEISSTDNLNDLAVYVNGTGTYSTGGTETTAHDCSGLKFKMTDDITYSHPADETDDYAENYTAIGGYTSYINENYFTSRFNGEFDGDGHTVSGIRIHKVLDKDNMDNNNNCKGLFGMISTGANIHDVRLTDARITGSQNVGGIVGYIAFEYDYDSGVIYSSGTVSGCVVTQSEIKGCLSVGGIVGQLLTYQSTGNGCNVGNCVITDSKITADGGYGTICGLHMYDSYESGTLQNNFYHGCTVNGTAITSGIGCDLTDITDNNGALPASLVIPNDGITIQTAMATGLGFSYDSDGDGQAENYWRSGAQLTLARSGNVPVGYDAYFAATAGTISEATLTGATLTVGNADAIVTFLHSDGQSHDISYMKADGTTATHAAIALDGTETNPFPGNQWYFVGKDITYSQTIPSGHGEACITIDGGEATIILGDGCVMNIGTSEKPVSGYGITYYKLNPSDLTIYGQTLDDANAGHLNIYSDKFYGIDLSDYTQHSGNVSITTKNQGRYALYIGIFTLNGGTLNVSVGDRWGIDCEEPTISGGKLDVTTNDNSANCGIYAYKSNITLGYTNADDHIHVNSYYVDTEEGYTVKIADGQYLYNGTEVLSGVISDLSKVNDKTLIPYIESTTAADGTAILYDNDAGLPDGHKNADRLAALAADGQQHNIMLVGRKLYKDGDWNTLCLPFSMTAEQVTAQLAPTALMTLSSSSFADGALTLNFEEASEIAAGQPYLIKWAGQTVGGVIGGNSGSVTNSYNTGSVDSQGDLVNPVFSSVTVSTASAKVQTDYVDFIGSTSPVTLTANDRTKLFLGAGSTLYYPSDDVTLNACRAYFELKGITAGDKANEARSFILNFGEESSGVTSPLYYREGQGAEPSWFTLDGRKLNGMPTTKGVYINNGKKVVIK